MVLKSGYGSAKKPRIHPDPDTKQSETLLLFLLVGLNSNSREQKQRGGICSLELQSFKDETLQLQPEAMTPAHNLTGILRFSSALSKHLFQVFLSGIRFVYSETA